MIHQSRSLIFAAFAAAALSACGGEERGNETAANATADGAVNGETSQGTIGETLGQTENLSSFAEAVNAAGLNGTFAGSEPYTVFAPTNAAFDKLPQGASEGLMRPEARGELTGILTYHIVPGVVTLADLGRAVETGNGSAELATAGGGTLTIAKADGGIVITDDTGAKARVSEADLTQSNGVIHVIDTVLMPAADEQQEG